MTDKSIVHALNGYNKLGLDTIAAVSQRLKQGLFQTLSWELFDLICKILCPSAPTFWKLVMPNDCAPILVPQL